MNGKSIYLFLLVLSLMTCKSEEFDLGLVPGSYTGLIDYFPVDSQGNADASRAVVSKLDEFNVDISEDKGNYVLSFDSARYEMPDLTLTTIPQYEGNTEDMTYVETIGVQAYSDGDMYRTGQPSSLFYRNRTDRYVGCNITLRSTDPDSVYFLQIAVRRKY